MARAVTLFTGQWADLPLAELAPLARSMGYDGLELACWGDHFDVREALASDRYVQDKRDLLEKHGLRCFTIGSHLVGQAVCDLIDERHKAILPEHVWGDGDPEGVRRRAAREMVATAKAARRFFDAAPDPVARFLAERTGRTVVVGFTGSPIWHLAYAFPPPAPGAIERGYADFAARWTPILDAFDELGVSFALEVHPTEIAFDLVSARRALAAVSNHRRFGFNFDPSHFGYQNADYLGFLREQGARVGNGDVMDVWWTERGEAGVFGGHADFGAPGRAWDFRSPGRGKLDFEAIARELNRTGYAGPLSVEWEDPGMDREHGAAEAEAFARRLDFPASDRAFDAAFAREQG
jgi:sugar phosphate isomerase/epimerase